MSMYEQLTSVEQCLASRSIVNVWESFSSSKSQSWLSGEIERERGERREGRGGERKGDTTFAMWRVRVAGDDKGLKQTRLL